MGLQFYVELAWRYNGTAITNINNIISSSINKIRRFCICSGITSTIKSHAYTALIVQCDTTYRIIKFQGTTSTAGKALAVVALATATTCCSIKQATHDVGAGGVAMAEAKEDLVAYLWDENEATVAFYVFT